MRHTVNYRITHVHIRGGHVDSGAQHLFPVGIPAVFHIFKQRKIFFHASCAGRILLAGLCQRTSVLPDLLCGKIGYISLSLFDQLNSGLIHLVKIIGGKEKPVLPVCAQPLYILLDGFHEFLLFLGGIRIIKTEIEFSAVFLCQTGV